MNDRKIKTIVSMAFFTAITFLGIQAFRIPVPAVVGTPFIHFGHVFVVLGMLLQGGRKGAVTGTAGLVILTSSTDMYSPFRRYLWRRL